jgi:uncharacterized protein YcgI (DUF1989 family)
LLSRAADLPLQFACLPDPLTWLTQQTDLLTSTLCDTGSRLPTEEQSLQAMAVGSNLVTIPARQGKALHLKKGQFIRVINTHGSQVVDTWAFKEHDLNELMSMEHTRSAILCLLPKVIYHG